MIDAYATEPHFLDHLAPVWAALPEAMRGSFYVHPGLAGRALERGVAATNAPVLVPGGAPVLVAAYGDIKRGRVAGRQRFAFLEHGAGQSYAGDPATARHHSYAGGAERDGVEVFLCPNEYSAARWRTAYPAARVEVVGSPILDTLPARDRDAWPGTTFALSFHWECVISPETGSAFREYSVFLLRELARHVTVIGHGHPRRRGLDTWYRAAGIEYVPDFRDVCRRADVYACDNSSTMFEFAATGRPVVVINSRRYRPAINHGGRFWDWATVGRQVSSPRMLASALVEAAADPPELRAAREAVVAQVYQPTVHGAAGRAAAVLVEAFAR